MKVKYEKISTLLIVLLLLAEIFHLTLLPKFLNIPLILFQLLLYGSLSLALIMTIRGVKIEWRMFLFVVFAGISLILSDADARYGAEERFMTWILLISAVGPLLYNNVLIRFRSKLLEATLYVFMLIGGVSFFYWVAGLPNLGRGHFTGIMTHSMLLAPIASLGGIYAFYLFFHAKSWRLKYIFISLFAFNAVAVLLAASRSAFVGFMIGIFILLLFSKFKYKKTIMLTVIILTFGLAVNMNDSDAYISSSDSNEVLVEMEKRGLENTRESLWRDRIAEFKAHPVFGVGFASQDDALLIGKKGSEQGNVEPGSTYLMILSMTGIFGTFAMLFFLSKPLFSRKFWRIMTKSEQYKLALFAFFSVHFLAEGYLFASGSLMAFVFWILVGSTYPYAGIQYRKELSKS